MHQSGLQKAIRYCGSQSKLARLINVPHNTLNDWLNQRNKIPYDRVVQIVNITKGYVTLKELAPYAASPNKFITKLMHDAASLHSVLPQSKSIQQKVIDIELLQNKIIHSDNHQLAIENNAFIAIGVDTQFNLIFGHENLLIHLNQKQQKIPAIVIDLELLISDENATSILMHFQISERVAVGLHWEKWKKSQLISESRPKWDKQTNRWDTTLAQILGFHSKNTYWRAKSVVSSGCTELIAAMNSKQLSITKAADIAKLSVEEQQIYLNDLLTGKTLTKPSSHHIKFNELLIKAGEKNEQLIIVHDRLDKLSVDDDFADLVIADPSAFLGNQVTNQKPAIIHKLIQTLSKKLAHSLHNGGSLYLLVDDMQTGYWQQALIDSGLDYKDVLVWHTNQVTKSSHYWQTIHQLIFWFCRGEPQHFHPLELEKMQSILSSPILKKQNKAINNSESSTHLIKPRWLLERLMNVSGHAGGNFLDPFASSTLSGQIANEHGMRAVLIDPDLPSANSTSLILPPCSPTSEECYA